MRRDVLREGAYPSPRTRRGTTVFENRAAGLWQSSVGGMDETLRSGWHELLRQRLLQLLFPLTVTWLVSLLAMDVQDDLLRIDPFPEGGLAHRIFERSAYPMAILASLAVIIGLQRRMLRRWPGFLRLPSSVPVIATAFGLVLHGAGLFVVVTVATVLISYLSYDSAKDPQGQFHIWVWVGGFLYAAAIVPAAALLTEWWAANRKWGTKTQRTGAP